MRASKTLSLLLSLIFLFPLTGAARSVDQHYAKQHRAMHWIVTEDDHDAYGCTATAIGPHALVTAEHCDMKAVDEDGTPQDGSPILFFVDPLGKPDYLTAKTPYKIQAKAFDGRDHMILFVSGPAFKDIVPWTTMEPSQGETVAWFGNPAGIRDMFREGYVMGVQSAPVPFHMKEQPLFLVAAGAVPGDSGSLVFDEKTGKIVGIVTYGVNDGQFMGMFALRFDASQILAAQLYDGREVE